MICTNCKAETNKLIGITRYITSDKYFGGICQKCWDNIQ